MGIDIYAHWDGESAEDMHEQVSSWLSIEAGDRGYLREAYHGEPYATRYLCAEAFETGEARIPASVLADRLPVALSIAEERERSLYGKNGHPEAVTQSFRDFVAFCERKERESGAPVRIVAFY